MSLFIDRNARIISSVENFPYSTFNYLLTVVWCYYLCRFLILSYLDWLSVKKFIGLSWMKINPITIKRGSRELKFICINFEISSYLGTLLWSFQYRKSILYNYTTVSSGQVCAPVLFQWVWLSYTFMFQRATPSASLQLDKCIHLKLKKSFPCVHPLSLAVRQSVAVSLQSCTRGK